MWNVGCFHVFLVSCVIKAGVTVWTADDATDYVLISSVTCDCTDSD